LQELTVAGSGSEARRLVQVQTALSGRELDLSRGQSLGESLKSLTGLYVIQTGPAIAKPVIHGLHSNRILILNNGVRQEGQQWGAEHAPEIDPFVGNRLSVIKGPASIRYGADAIGGVILVEPKALPTQPGTAGELNLVGATNGRTGVASGFLEGAVSADRFGGKLAGLSGRVQATLKRAGFARAPSYFLDNTSYRETNGSVELAYRRARFGTELYYSLFSTSIGLFSGAQVGSLDDFYAALARPEPAQQPGFSYALDKPYQQVTHQLIKARVYVDFQRLGRSSAVLAHQQNQREEYDIIGFTGRGTPELALRLSTQTLDLLLDHKRGTNWSGTVGLNGLSQTNIRQYLFLIPNFQSYGAGLFATQRHTTAQWTLEAGLRYDYRWLQAYFLNEATKQTTTDTRHWTNANGSVAATFRPIITTANAAANTLEITANLSTAWRAPNASELYANGLHQSAVAYERGNTSLGPEQALNAGLSVDYTAGRFLAEIGAYNNLIHNYIYLKPDSVPIIRQRGAFPAYSYTQADAVFRGLDLNLRYQLSKRLAWVSKTSLLWAADRTNRAFLMFVPPHRTDQSLRYERPAWGRLSDVSLAITGLYVARQQRVPAIGQRADAGQVIFTGDFAPPPPAYFLLGAEASATLRLGRRAVTVSVLGQNLLNTSYRDYLDRFRYFADAPGRNVAIKLKFPFSLSNS
jgi:iron complex outermembrane recepter protein